MGVPEGWTLTTTESIQAPGEYACVGGPFGSALTSRDYVSGGVPVIRGNNLAGKSRYSFADDGFVYVSDEKAATLARNLAYPGDLVVTQRGTLGQVAIIPQTAQHSRYVISQSQMKLTADHSRADIGYLYYYFSSDVALEHIRNNTLATGIPHINLQIFREFPVLLPPLPEQRKIAAILSSVDEAIEKTQAVIDQVQVVKKGLMQELLTKGLPGRHQKFKQTEIGTIPESWEVRQLGELGTNGVPAVRTGPFGSALKTEHFTSSGTPVLTIQSLGEGEVNSEGLFYVGSAKAHELRDYEVVPGDLVFSRVADIGRSIVVPEHASGWIISSNLMRISADRARVHSDYLMYSIVGGEPILSQLRSVAGDAGRPVVSATIVKGILVPLPPLQEQIDISSIIASTLDYSKTLDKQVLRLTEVKSALMQSLLTGQTRVTP